MIHHSPMPDVDIPDLPLTEYVLAGGRQALYWAGAGPRLRWRLPVLLHVGDIEPTYV